MDDGAPDRMIGRTLGGRYRIEGRIARGGMATVYYAVDDRLDRPVALKVMLPSLSADPAFVSRFMSEARAAAALSHPNIVAVFDQGTDGDLGFLAMEYVQGRTLRDVLREYGPLTPRQTLSIMEPMLAALGTAHRAGLVHRDVKPENVLVGDDGVVKVADFGLVRAADEPSSQTAAGLLLGTVAYISPEQVDGGKADARSDVYAAGIVLYELLTGAKPYAGETSLHIAYQHANSDVPPPSAHVRDLSPPVDGLVALATHRDPKRRPADADAYLAEVLRVHRTLTDAELDAGGTPRAASAAARSRSGQAETAVALAAPADQDTSILPGHRRPAAQSYPPPTSQGSNGDGALGFPDTTTQLVTARRGARRGGRRRPPRTARSRRRGGLAMTFLLAASLVVGLFAWWLGGGGHANVPNVVGLSEVEAVTAASEAGLRVQVGPPVFSDDIEPGLIASSDPPPGTRVTRGSDLILYPSRGPELFAVPDLVGKSLTQAESLLAEAGLRLGEVTEQHDPRVPDGVVMGTEPEAGEELRRDSAVVVIVSSGPQPVDVPNVVGETVENARAILDAAGLAVTEQTDPSEEPAGTVIAQDPAEGSVPTGTTVALTISTGPQLVVVPDVLDMKIDKATEVLEDADLTPNVTLDLPSRRDEVVVQDPGPGSEVPIGTTIRLVIS